MGKYEPYSQRRKKRKKEYGESMFRVLNMVLLVIGILIACAGFFLDGYLTLMLTIGVNIILFSFAFKFAESVIALLKEIKQSATNQ